VTVVTFLASGWTPRSQLKPAPEHETSAPAPAAALQRSWESTRALILKTLERFPDAFEAVRLAFTAAVDTGLVIAETDLSP
jgi:hypothetical protein